MFKLNDLVQRKSDGMQMRIGGFADSNKLPKLGDKFYEHVRFFSAGIGIPPEFEEQHRDTAPSIEAIFCYWYEADENHPLRIAQRTIADQHIAEAVADDKWKEHPVYGVVEKLRSEEIIIGDLKSPEGELAILKNETVHLDAELPFFGKASDIMNMDEETIKANVLAFIEACDIRDGFVHAWFEPSELIEVTL